MNRILKDLNKEYLFISIFILLLFLLDIFDRNEPGLQWHKIAYKLNYTLAALTVNYFLLPRYFYSKRYGVFSIGFLIVIITVVFVDEYFVEWLFYRNSSRFENVVLFRTFIDSIPTILLIIGFKFAWDSIQKQQNIDTLKRMIAESELQFLNSQINPHFLFNNLNTLYAHALDNSPKTPEIIVQLSSILRYMLYDCKNKTVPLTKEIANLKDYIQLNEFQLAGKGEVTISVEGSSEHLHIAPLILIVFVENAFKHSQTSLLNNIKIKISIKIERNSLFLYCENNYSEDSNADVIANGIGLKNVKGRLDLNYKDSYNLNIESKTNWYKVFLKIELKRDEQ